MRRHVAVACDTSGRQSRWTGLTGAEKTAGLAIGAVALTAVALIADGLYIKAKASLSQVLLERSFAADLAGAGETRPWPWADFVTEARIVAPRLGEAAIVLGGASGETLAFGPALLNGTPRPGEPGTSVIAAHRDTHFRWLKDLRPGDHVEITRRDGHHLVFRARGGRIAHWNSTGIDPDSLGVHLALATCWPFDDTTRGPLRYIVDLELVHETVPADRRVAQTVRDTSALSQAFLR